MLVEKNDFCFNKKAIAFKTKFFTAIKIFVYFNEFKRLRYTKLFEKRTSALFDSTFFKDLL